MKAVGKPAPSVASDHADVTRRQAVAALTAGFALAVRPVSAETITTSAEGLEAGEVRIDTPDGGIPAYRAAPVGAGPFPVVLVVQEIFGVHEHIKDICRRLAKIGYLAVAPELYARQGDVSQIKDFSEIISKVVSKVPDKQVLSDLDAAVTWAAGHGGDTARLGVTGFCWGGRIVWLYAAHNPALKAGVAWYGRLDAAKDDLHPENPIDLAATLKAPVLGLYGGQDTGIPLDTVEQMKAALASAGAAGNAAARASEFVVYPDMPHAFHADYRPSYRAGPAQDGFARALAWFKAKGVA
jgi:carboxymethylenebutenolidase